MNRRHFRRRLSFVGASLAGLGFGRGSATQQPPEPPSSPPRSFAGPPRAGAAPSRAAAVSGPPRAAASAASARAPPRTAAPARLCLDERLLALARRPIRMDSGPLDRAAPRASLDPRLLATTGRRAARYRRTLELRARRAARRLPRKPRNASGNARRRCIAADEHRAPVFGAAICRTPLRAREGRRRTSDAANARARRRRPADSSRRRRLTLSPRSPDSIAPSQ